jgi:hypothetical protein
MQEKCFKGVAGGRVVGFRVNDDGRGLVHASIRVYISMANAVRMAHHRNTSVFHDELDKGIASPWDHEINAGI